MLFMVKLREMDQ